jgi:hypothetical protein
MRKINLALTLLIGVAVWLTAGVAFAHGLVDQSNLGYGGGTLISVHIPIGQEFTPFQPILVAVDIAFRGGNPENETDTITVNIRKGTITSPVLASTSQVVPPCPNMPPYTCGLTHFDFSTPLQVTPGDIYVLELTATNGSHAWMHVDGGYASGAAIIQGNVEPAFDFAFQTYYLPSIEVAVDIKPGSDVNAINPQSNGKIAVAIPSTPSFDAPTQVDEGSLTFGRTGNEQSLAFCNGGLEDINGDGLADLVCHFYTPLTGFQSGDTVGILKGETVNGLLISGDDSVRIVP